MSDLTVTRVVNSVAVTGNSTEVVVEQAVQGVAVAAPGPQGPVGPAGPAGAPGGSAYEHTQSVAASTWTVSHNLGRLAHVSILDPDGTEVEADIVHSDVNTVVITWPSPHTGTAIVS